MLKRSRTALFVALFIGACSLGMSSLQAQTTTGSINGNANSAAVPFSSDFSNALSKISAGDHLGAYQQARGFANNYERRAIQWAAIYYSDGDIGSQFVQNFAADAADLGTQSLYKKRLEQALLRESASSSQIVSILGGQMPVLIDAQIALAQAYVATGERERGFRIASQIWTTQFLNTEQEAKLNSEFARGFSNEMHWQRAVHLLMHDRARGAERLFQHLTPGQKSLALGRIAVSRKQANAASVLSQVDRQFRNHPLFHFSSGQLARRQGNLLDSVELFNKVGNGELPDSAEWWYERRYLTRQLITAKQYRAAYTAAAAYQNGPEGRVVDSNFHAGWIALEFLNDPQTAIGHFEKMGNFSTLESSITKYAYWLGRAHQDAGNQSAAVAAYQNAARFPNSYYGILSRFRLGITELNIRPMPDPSGRIAHFENLQLVRVIKLFAAAGQPKLAEPLVARLVYSVVDGGDMVLTARLAQSLNAHNLAVLMADIAGQRGFALDLFNYPRDGVPSANQLAQVDLAAVYAVARQESKFDFDVISHAGARGLMQLMPATAKETANRLGIGYSVQRLTSDPEYNALLGSTYLRLQLQRYDGSLILASAAYNAGAGNVNKWLTRYGNPMDGSVDPVVWIEQIPFAETRNYVQRVVANFIVYRARLGLPKMTIAEVLRSI